ncbi:MAG: aminodeoxychorismate/anthranilate synthase component II [Pirellulales bacterium]
MILLIDNYDSFVHNLARYFERLGQRTRVVRCDAIDASGVRAMRPDAVVLSPGPRTPTEAGASLEIVGSLCAELPLLGICLGHQVIARALGGRIVRTEPVHGQASMISHEGRGLFDGLPSPLAVGRYHSLVVEPASLPGVLRPTAWTDAGELMAFEHAQLPVYGVQFHPESILCEHGYELLANFLRRAGCPYRYEAADLGKSEVSQPLLAKAD